MLCLFSLLLLLQPPAYSQKYKIFIRDQPVGTESVTESADPQGHLVSSSEHDILVTDGMETKRMAFQTRLVLDRKNLVPVSYVYRYTSGAQDYYEVKVKGSQIIRVLTRSGRSSEASVPLQPDVVLLDFNVYHHYDFLVRRYDARKGGRQVFHNFIPLIGAEVPLALTRLDDSTLDESGTAIAVRNFRVEFVGIFTGTVSIDHAGRLVRLVVPQQDLQVVREK